MTIPPEGAVARLRYSLGGDRPSQTTHQPPSPLTAGEGSADRRVVFHRRLQPARKPAFSASHLSSASASATRWQAVVKLHGVFLSRSELAASSRPLQFHRAPGRDSAQVVMPFVRVGTYPTRNFATLDCYSYSRRLPGLRFGACTPPLNLPAPAGISPYT